MFNGKTVIVLGAGASAEVGIPLGREFTRKIESVLSVRMTDVKIARTGDHLIIGALEKHAKENMKIPDLLPYQEACDKIVNAMPLALSIDAFIHGHKKDDLIEICGKVAIVRCILDAELRSDISVDMSQPGQHINFIRTERSWYSQFWKLLTHEYELDQVAERLGQLTFIIFNYDRCFEHFLHQAVQVYYGVDENNATAVLENLTAFHPYGTVGQLPWQATGNTIDYGSDISARALLPQADGIRTYSERVEEAKTLEEIRSAIQQAYKLVFLGFRFHQQNMKILTPEERGNVLNTFATAVGISESNCTILQEQLTSKFGNRHQNSTVLEPKKDCFQLFDEYWLNFSLK